jgi:SAM-dependent methyltransferase/ribosomal protein S18 acetylase RimI-like enzyme
VSRWTLLRVRRRAAEVIREEGIASLWFKVLGEILYRRAVLLERPLDEPILPVSSRVPVDIGLLSETQIDDYCSFRPEADPAQVRQRLEEGQRCFVARHEGRIVHACWTTDRQVRIDYLDREIQLAPDEVYAYDSFTSPGYRGQSIAAARSAWMAQHFKDAGYRRLMAIIMPENRAAFRPPEKVGYRPIALMGYVKLGPWRRDFCRLRQGAVPPGGPPSRHGSAYWDRVAGEMSTRSHYMDPFLGEMKRQAHLGLIRRWGGVPAAGWVLKTDLFEEAMGPDAILDDLSPGNGAIVGIDISPAIAGQALRRDSSRQATYVAADVRCLPFVGGSFSLIVSPSTLDHFADPSDLGRSLRELRRVLEPAGQLIVTLDNRQNILDFLFRLVARWGWVRYYVGRSYPVAALREELETAGLRVQDTTAILHNPRLMAVAAVTLANALGWRPFTALVHRALTAAQRLEKTRWRYRTGSFVAARATRATDSSRTGR